MKVGALIIGLRGATASTVVATARVATDDEIDRFLLSERVAKSGRPLPEVRSISFGGWDTFEERWEETLDRHDVLDRSERAELARAMEEEVSALEPLALGEDHAVVSGEVRSSPRTGKAALEKLRADIRDFKRKSGVDHVVVVNLGAPAKLPPKEAWPATAEVLLEQLERGKIHTAAPYYFAAAALEGAGIVDYTASATLEMNAMIELCQIASVPVAGRDGSTGQTLLKSVLAEMFKTRKLSLAGWYSTNILGNHDGLVLMDDRYADVKHHDKTALLDEILGYEVDPHLVDIRYYRPLGDNKEAWDAIDFVGWHGMKGHLRTNWRASDSFLAAPMIIDLIRMMGVELASKSSGIQPQLGVFFKHPLGTEERRYLALARSFERYYLE